MARMISWPAGIRCTTRQPLSGPRAIGASSTETIGGGTQTVASPFGLWAWTFALPPLKGAAFRRWRGFVTALHAGANVARVPMCDPDGFGWADLGLTRAAAGVPWGSGRPWASGQTWATGRPPERIAATAHEGDTLVSLAADRWGDLLDIGDRFGFAGRFGLYEVTERRRDGRLRVWPPLRADIAAGGLATLTPVLAMRLASADLPNLARGPSHATDLAITLIEVEHADAIAWAGA